MKPAIEPWIETRAAASGPDALPAPSVLELMARWPGPSAFLTAAGRPTVANPSGAALLAVLAPFGPDRVKQAATAAPCSLELVSLSLPSSLSMGEPKLVSLIGGLLARADEAMSRAKRACKNRCELAATARIP
jgi:hypothetical protein